jgi:hypothetical protein
MASKISIGPKESIFHPWCNPLHSYHNPFSASFACWERILGMVMPCTPHLLNIFPLLWIRNSKQGLRFVDYQSQNLQTFQRHIVLSLLNHYIVVLFQILQWLRNKNFSVEVSHRLFAFYARNHVLVEWIRAFHLTLYRPKPNVLLRFLLSKDS